MVDQSLATALVLLAALLHAGWNVLVKVTAERLVVMAALNGAGVLCGLLLLGAAAPLPAGAWTCALASAAFNALYQVLLIAAYGRGDLGHVYPIVRSVPPILVAAIANLLAPALDWYEVAGAAIVSAGIASLLVAAPRGSRNPGAYLLAGFAGAAVGCYTLLDAAGIRQAGDTFSYIAHILLLQNLPLFLFVLATRRAALRRLVATQWPAVVAAGSGAVGSYGLVLWALSLGTVVQIAALREVSVIFAAVLARMLLREPFGNARLAAAAVVTFGIVAIKLA